MCKLPPLSSCHQPTKAQTLSCCDGGKFWEQEPRGRAGHVGDCSWLWRSERWVSIEWAILVQEQPGFPFLDQSGQNWFYFVHFKVLSLIGFQVRWQQSTSKQPADFQMFQKWKFCTVVVIDTNLIHKERFKRRNETKERNYWMKEVLGGSGSWITLCLYLLTSTDVF